MKNYFDVGANRGKYCLSWASNNNLKIYAFEPNKILCDSLVKRAKNFPNCEIYNYAIDSTSGDKKFYISNNDACSSLLPFDEIGAKNWHTKLYTIREDVVQSIRLDNFMEKNSIKKIDFLKIDTQGSDFEVIKSLGHKIVSVNKVLLEAFTTPKNKDLYVGEGKEKEITEYMLENDFRLNNRAYGGATNKFVNLEFINLRSLR